MKYLCSWVILLILLTQSIMAQNISSAGFTSPTGTSAALLPNISLIGTLLGSYSDRQKSFDVAEIEFAFQQYLYPSIRADIFAALHKESDGVHNFELEEGYVTFFDVFDLIVPDNTLNWGIGAIMGKKRLSIGKTNALHREQWQFVDRAIVLEEFFAGEEALAAEGIQLSSILPLPFFSQLETGIWTAAAHGHDEHSQTEVEESGIEYSNRLFHSRLWNSFGPGQGKEFELGLNYLLGNASASSADDKQSVYGADLTYTLVIDANQRLQLQSEWYQAEYGHEGEPLATQIGYLMSATMDWDQYYQTGIRYSNLESHDSDGDSKTQWSFLFRRKLTHASHLKVQYNTGEQIENTVLVAFIFGMGPHSDVLQ